ncbi:MAG: hypothetical protein ACTSRP_20525 [Candidatus Helarchaeota archaeon]
MDRFFHYKTILRKIHTNKQIISIVICFSLIFSIFSIFSIFLDEANLIFQYLHITDNRVSPNEITKCNFYLNNTGNLTATDIIITLYCKYENSSYIPDQIINYSLPIQPSKTSNFLSFDIMKNKTGTYYYIIKVQYNYTWGVINYTKYLNSSIIQIIVGLQSTPTINLYLSVYSGKTSIIMEFHNWDGYVNLTYNFMIQIDDLDINPINITVLVGPYTSNMTYIYDIIYSPDQLDWWEKFIYYTNFKIERKVTIHYEVSVNDSEGNKYSYINIYFYGSRFENIDASNFSVPVYLVYSFTYLQMIFFMIIILGGIFAFGYLITRFKSHKEPSEYEKLFSKITSESFIKRKPIENKVTRIELLSKRNDILKWMKDKPEFYSNYKKLKNIYPKIIAFLAIFMLVSFITLMVSIPFLNLILVYIMLINLILSVPCFVIFYKIDQKLLKNMYFLYIKDHPEIIVIKKDTWIYIKKYRSLPGFILGSIIYGALTYVLLIITLSKMGSSGDFFLFNIISLFGALFFGLLFGIIYYFLFNYTVNPTVYYAIFAFVFGYLWAMLNFDSNYIPIIIPIGIFSAIVILISFLINKLINTIINRYLLNTMISDLNNYFKENSELYLPNWNFLYDKHRFNLFIKGLDKTSFNLNIEGSYLIKKS